MASLATSHPSFPFLRLPLELREKIYFYLLPYNKNHVFESDRGCNINANFSDVLVHSKWSSEGRYKPPDEWVRKPIAYNVSILSVNRQINGEASAFLFRGSTIKMIIWQWGIDFLEPKSGDNKQAWYKSFLAGFNYSQPKKIVIEICASTFCEPERIVGFRQSILHLCEVLRMCPQIAHLEIRLGVLKGETGGYVGSYFDCDSVKETFEQWALRPKVPSKPWNNQRRIFYTCHGKLKHTVSARHSDLELVIQPFHLLRNVTKASILVPHGAQENPKVRETVSYSEHAMENRVIRSIAHEKNTIDGCNKHCQARFRKLGKAIT